MRFIGRRSLVGAAIVLLLLIVNSGIAAYSIAMIGEDSRQMRDSYDAHLLVAQLFSLLQDAEIGQRGYLLTSDDAYLAPYRDATSRLQSSIDALTSSAAHQPELAQHLPTLQSLIGQKLDELRYTVDLHRQGKHDEAIAMMRSGDGKRLMDMIREEIAQIDQMQQQRLGQAQATLAQRFVLVQVGLGVALVVSLGLLGLVVVLISRDMQERTRVASELARERGVLHATITSIGDGLIATDVQGHITFMNPVAEQLTGWTQDEAQGQPLDEVFRIISQSTRQTVESPVAKVLRSGMIAGLANHTLLIAKDGSERPIDDSGAPIHDQMRQLLGVVLVFRDITERYAAEAALRSSEARFRALADTIAPLVFSMDAGGAITYLNQRCYDYAGRSGAGSLSAFWRDLIHPADRADVLAGWEQSRCAGEMFVAEYRMRRADGCYRWFLNRIVPTRHADGDIIGWFGSCTDIDDQRRTVDNEHFLAEASYTMVRTTQYEQALDAVARLAVPAVADLCIIQVLDDEGALAHTAIAHTDPARAALIQPIQRVHLPFAAPADPARARLIADITDDMIALLDASPPLRDLAMRFGPKAVIFAPMSLRHQSLGGVTLAIDTGERSYGPGDLHMAEELARRLSLGIDNARLFREAQVAITVRDEFLSIASHELRTPLTALLGYGEMLQRRAEENPAFQERDRYAIRVMLTRIEHLYKMVTSMLDLSRLQSRQLMIECTSVRLCPLIRRVIFEAQAVHSKSRVVFNGCEDQEIVIEGDELRLEQVFQNLLENALKYSSEPNPVIFTLEEHESYVLISVADHGIGIPKEDLPQLFQRFYRASNIDGRRVSGMGLGLYVVKEIVSLHHGTITVTSEEGKGSTFTVRLPKSGMAEEWPQ